MTMIPVSLQTNALLQWLQGPKVGRLTLAVNLLLVLWLAWLLAKLTWLVMAPPAENAAAPPAPTAPVSAAPAGQAVNSGSRIAALHLFGEADSKPAAVAQEVVPLDAPETRLKLVLSGLYTAEVPEQALAIIAEPGGDEKPYRIGDPLPGGAELKEIYADRIILSRAGRYETLRLVQDDAIGGMNRAPATLRPAGNSAEDPGLVLQQYRESLRENPQSLLSLVRPLPVEENGQLVGFRLLPGRERGFLQQMGLRPGDIVTAINGQALDSPARGMQALQALQDQTNVNLEIRRGGQTMALNFQVPQ